MPLQLDLDVLISIANVIYLLSYSVRDILWLRILTVVGATLLLPYYYLQPDPLLVAIAWNIVFIAINIVWIAKLTMDRRPVVFSDAEKRLYRIALRGMPERDATKLFGRAEWRSIPAGETVQTQGRAVDSLMLISDGSVSVKMDGELVDTLGEGRFLGVTAYLNRAADYVESVTIATTEPTRVATWPISELESQLADDTDLEVSMEASLGLELSRFLQTARLQILHSRPV